MIVRRLLHGPSPTPLRAHPARGPPVRTWAPSRRPFASKSEADVRVEEMQELYASAKDEFEIAVEETEKKSIYAQADRQAAREELVKLKEAFAAAVEKSDPAVGSEVQRRVGQRVRELESAVTELNKADLED